MTESEPSTRWTIHGERVIDESRRLRLSIAEVELPDGARFEQYVLRLPQAAVMVVLDEPREHVLMMWRHRFIVDRWVWELPGGYVDPDEDPAVTATREVEEETGWRPREFSRWWPSADAGQRGRREPAVHLSRRRPREDHPTPTRHRRWNGSRLHQFHGSSQLPVIPPVAGLRPADPITEK